MRDKLDELRFSVNDLLFTLKVKLGRVTDRTKYIALSFLVVSGLAVSGLMLVEAYNYKPVDISKEVPQAIDVARETVDQADLWIGIGSTAEAFDLLVTHKNHFSEEYNEREMEMVESRLDRLSKDAEEGDIEKIYSMKDLVEQQPIYKFTGIVVAVDNDPLYGVTHMVSKTGERSQEQLEVTGLKDISVNSQVEFYGVPKFDSVSNPIKVEAYVVPVE